MVVNLEGAPLDIPDTVAVDVSGLDAGESILFANIELPGNVKMVSDDNIVCVEVISAKAAAALAAAGDAAAAAAAEADEAAVADAADGGAATPEVPVEGESEETESE